MTRAQRIRLFLGIMLLGERRNPASGSRWSKVLEWFGAALACLYLSACGVGLGFLAKDIGPYTIVGVMPFVLIVDFSMRFASRKKPIDITPYLTLPVKRSEVIDSLLLSSLAAGYNFVWLCLFIPHSITLAAMGVATLPEAAGIALVCQFLIEANCLWQLLVRSLTNKSLAWWALPAMSYAMPMAGVGKRRPRGHSRLLCRTRTYAGFYLGIHGLLRDAVCGQPSRLAVFRHARSHRRRH